MELTLHFKEAESFHSTVDTRETNVFSMEMVQEEMRRTQSKVFAEHDGIMTAFIHTDRDRE